MFQFMEAPVWEKAVAFSPVEASEANAEVKWVSLNKDSEQTRENLQSPTRYNRPFEEVFKDDVLPGRKKK